MARRSTRYLQARKAYDDAIEARNMVFTQHGQTISLFKQIESQLELAEKELKESAKNDAANDPNFRFDKLADAVLQMSLIENREVDFELLKSRLPTELFERIRTVKEYVTVDAVEKGFQLGILSDAQTSGVIKTKGFSIRIEPTAQEART